MQGTIENGLETYQALAQAIAILKKARVELLDEPPAWMFVYHAEKYLEARADRVMRGVE